MITKILVFLKSFYWHLYSGCPKATQNQIEERFKICLDCPYYDNTKSLCLQCGCNINNKKIFMNKLAWADQKCPIDKWTKLG